MSERYVAPGPVDLVGFLCLASANGLEVEPAERRLGVTFPTVLREYLSRRGVERISPAEEPLLDMSAFRVEDGHLILGGGEGYAVGVALSELDREDPPVALREGEEWVPMAGKLSHFLLAGIDQRLRACHVPRRILPFAARDCYTACPNLEPRELLDELERPDPEWQDEMEEEEEEWSGFGSLILQNVTYPYDEKGKLVLPEGLEAFLRAHLLEIEDAPRALAVDLATMTLYSARFGEDGGFESLLQVRPQHSAQIRPQPTAEPFELVCRSVDETLDTLAREVHDPALAYTLSLLPGLPEGVRPLAQQEGRRYAYRSIQLFLELFEGKKVPFQLGRRLDEDFVAASGLRNEGELSVLWSVRPLNANPFPWSPALAFDGAEPQAAPAALEGFLKEALYKPYSYILLNRYTFLARKMVTPGEFSRATADWTEEERFALLSFLRKALRAVLERLFTCIQEGKLTVWVGGGDLLERCPAPLEQLPGWLAYYRRPSLDFLDTGFWKQ